MFLKRGIAGGLSVHTSIVGQSQRSSSVVHFGRGFGTGHGAAANRGCHTIERMTVLSKREGHRDRRCVKKLGGPNTGPAVHVSTPSQPVQGVNVLLHCKVRAKWTRTPRSSPLMASALTIRSLGWFVECGREAQRHFSQNVHGAPSSYLWEDSSGVTHILPQGEGGEQGDPWMPFLFSLGQHSALECKKICSIVSLSLCYMIHTSFPTEWEMCTTQLMRICGSLPASASTAARRMCGMQRSTRVLRHVGGHCSQVKPRGPC